MTELKPRNSGQKEGSKKHNKTYIMHGKTSDRQNKNEEGWKSQSNDLLQNRKVTQNPKENNQGKQKNGPRTVNLLQI